MAETLVEEKICEACGAEVRPGSLFCYNCGGPVGLDLEEKPKSNRVSSAWFQGELGSNLNLETTQLSSDGAPIAKEEPVKATGPIDAPLTTVAEAIESEEKKESTPAKVADPKAKTAAAMKRKSKTFQAKPLEVVWEEPESGPNAWFPLVAFVLVLIVLGIFFLANYLK